MADQGAAIRDAFATALRRQNDGELAAAEAIWRDILAIDRQHGDALHHLGTLLHQLGRNDEAAEVFARAVSSKPLAAEVHFAHALALQEIGKLDEAGASYERALALKPDYPEANLWSGLLLIKQGKFAQAWSRIERRPALYRDFPQPLWDGRPLLRETLLVQNEGGWAGLGDTIQFCRYLSILQEKCPNVLFEVQRPLTKLMADSFGAGMIVQRDEAISGFDWRVPIFSLPCLLKTKLETIPAAVPYLRTDPALVRSWAERLARFGRPRVGVVWASNPLPPGRSVPLAALRPILEIPGIDFFSLQVGERTRDLADEPDLNICDLSPLLTDFSETAAAMTQLDLCISVDTSVAHLAGALARPVWVLLRFAAYSLWLIDREDSPWYPTMRFFRQDRRRDWGPVIDRLAADLLSLAQGNRSVLAPRREVRSAGGWRERFFGRGRKSVWRTRRGP